MRAALLLRPSVSLTTLCLNVLLRGWQGRRVVKKRDDDAEKAGRCVTCPPEFTVHFGYCFGNSIAAIIAKSCFFNVSFLSQSEGRCAVAFSHSSSVKSSVNGTQPGSAGGAMIRSMVVRRRAGIGRCTLPSQLSTVRLVTCRRSASSARVVPDRFSHSCSRSFNIAKIRYDKIHKKSIPIRQKSVKIAINTTKKHKKCVKCSIFC